MCESSITLVFNLSVFELKINGHPREKMEEIPSITENILKVDQLAVGHILHIALSRFD